MLLFPSQVKARGAKLIIITDKKSLANDLDDDPIVIPSNGPLTALGAVLPLQLIAYELAMLRYVDVMIWLRSSLLVFVSHLLDAFLRFITVAASIPTLPAT